MRRAIAAGLVAALALPTAAGQASAQPSRAPALTCPAVSEPASSRQVAWETAAAALNELAGPSTLPFGRTGSGPYLRTGATAWTSGFYPTALWAMYAHTGSPQWLTLARRYTARVLPTATWTGTHDLGFMVGLPAAAATTLDPERAAGYQQARLAAARSLSTRWNPRVKAMRSARYLGRWGLIVDSAMNAPLLIEAGRVLGGREGERLIERGHQHLLTLARSLVRPDGSTVHRMAFDATTGRPIGPLPGQGLSGTSTWARGQAWAIDGFARGYALTADPALLAVARATADYWLGRVPAGCIPAWDLDVGRASAPRDSSAAAIAADGLLRLADLDPDAERRAVYRGYAEHTLDALTSAPFMRPQAPGVLQGQSYNVPAVPHEGTYAWGDAFLLLALLRSAGTALGDDPAQPKLSTYSRSRENPRASSTSRTAWTIGGGPAR